MADNTGRPTLYQIGGETLTVSTTAIALAYVPSEAVYALIYVADNPIRWQANQAPTSTAGMVVASGDTIDFTTPYFNYNTLLKQIRFIRDSASSGSATLAVLYFTTL